MDHEGEVGEGSQHESWDEAGGDVVAWLAYKVDDHLKEFSIFQEHWTTFLVSLFPPASTMV